MKVGDLVRFRGSDLVVGVIVDDEAVTSFPKDPLYDEDRVGIVWLNGFGTNVLTFQPVSHLEVVSEAS